MRFLQAPSKRHALAQLARVRHSHFIPAPPLLLLHAQHSLQQVASVIKAAAFSSHRTVRPENMQRVAKMRELLQDSTDIVVKTVRDKDAAPPRYFATIWADGVNVNDEVNKAAP